MAKDKVTYQCSECEYTAPQYLGKCPECNAWGSFTQHVEKKAAAALTGTPKRDSFSTGYKVSVDTDRSPRVLASITADESRRQTSGYAELDRVLGGGITPGAYVLIGGDPGIGKSTLMLQMAAKVATKDHPVLYVAGEESPYQIRMRAERLKLPTQHILVLPENNIHDVAAAIEKQKPALVIIDSIQAMYSPNLAGTPGSVGQIKECAGLLMEVAKTTNTSIFLVGHVTKDGQVSGPKLLEHTVDVVLYFEGDKYQNLRILRTVKNRFGSTQEIGVFEIAENGLNEVTNPSKLFLSSGASQHQPGSVIVATMEGTRPILVELQALVGQSTYAAPRRVSNGVEQNRLHQIIAVLERRLGLSFAHYDTYVNVVGGLRIDEPAADLGIALALITSSRNVSVTPGTVVCGEIGLTGEIRAVTQAEKRVKEAERIGFTRMILPATESHLPDNRLELLEAQTLMDAIKMAIPSLPPQKARQTREEAWVETLPDYEMQDLF